MMDEKTFRFMLIFNGTILGMIISGLLLILIKNNPMFDGVTISDFSYLPWLVLEILLAFFIELIIVKSNKGKNIWSFICAFFLVNFSLLIIGRLDTNLIVPQIRWIIIGIIFFMITFRFKNIVKKLLNYEYVLGLFFLILVVISIFFGSEIVGIIRLQPLEFAKIFLILFLASYLGNYKKSDIVLYALNFIICILAITIFIKTDDFGNSFLLFLIATFLTYISTGKKLHLFVPITFFLLSLIFIYNAFSSVKHIFDVWLDPWMDLDKSKNFFEVFFAIGEGGIWGTGFSIGHPNFIPNVLTNLMIAAVAEELGLLGVILLIIVYSMFFYQAVSMAFNLKNVTEILLEFGIGILFFLQTFITIISAVNIIPSVNLTIPFMSYGGSGMITNFIMLAILISFSRKENFE